MTLTPQDWGKLRFPILGLGAAFIVIGLLVSLADQYRSSHESALQKQQNLFNQARQKFQFSGMEKESIIQYLPVYNELLAKGFIGEERRIEWIERLRQIHADRKLFSIDYSIGQQERYIPKFIPSMGTFIMQRSTMTLDLDMLHEGDLTHLLGDLRENTPPFIVRDCEITRPVGAMINAKKVVANLKAKCEIDWLTLRNPQLKRGL